MLKTNLIPLITAITEIASESYANTLSVTNEALFSRFLWPKHQLDYLCTLSTSSCIEERLSLFPYSLEKVFDKIYEESTVCIGPEKTSVIEAAFSWLLHCRMPLSKDAFAKAVSYTLDGCPKLTLAAILDACFNFIEIDETMNVFRFTHLSVREYLLKKRIFRPALANSQILLSYLNHISTHSFRISPNRYDKYEVRMNWQYQGTKAVLKCPSSYIYLFWPTHLGLSEECRFVDRVSKQLTTFFRQSFADWVETARVIVLSGQMQESSYEPRLGLFLRAREYYGSLWSSRSRVLCNAIPSPPSLS